MCDPDAFRTVNYMPAIAIPQNPAITPTLGRDSKGWHKTKFMSHYLAAILLGAVAAAFFVSALMATPPATTPQRHTPAVQPLGPPSSQQILSRLNHNDVAPHPGRPHAPAAGR
jgi:hypothetical protein